MLQKDEKFANKVGKKVGEKLKKKSLKRNIKYLFIYSSSTSTYIIQTNVKFLNLT